MQFFSDFSPLVVVLIGVFISSVTVSIVLRWIYRNPGVRTIGHVIVIILGALGVFCIITVAPVFLYRRGWAGSWVIAILVSLIIGFLATDRHGWIFGPSDETIIREDIWTQYLRERNEGIERQKKELRVMRLEDEEK